MILTTYFHEESQFKNFVQLGFKKLIIEDINFSLLSTNNLKKINYKRLEKFLNLSLKKKINLIFNMDILFHNLELKKAYNFLNILYEIGYKTIRLKDIGLAWYIKCNFPNLYLEINTITGNYNYRAISFWKKIFNCSLKTMILNKEIPYNEIEKIIQKSSMNSEIQVHGPIQIFYTNRHLISQNEIKKNAIKNRKEYELLIFEKKNPKEKFKFYENNHGSFMFYSKELCLLKKIPIILNLGLKSLLFDFRNKSLLDIQNIMKLYDFRFNNTIFPNEQNILDKIYPFGVTEGFFHENKTDSNIRSKNKIDNNYVGKVLSIIKDKLIAIEFYENIYKCDLLKIKTPSNKEFSFNFTQAKDLNGNFIDKIKAYQIVFLSWKSSTIPESLIYKINK